MKLSEQLRQDHECGDFGKALEGYAERAERLEDEAWLKFYLEARDRGAPMKDAREYADRKLDEI